MGDDDLAGAEGGPAAVAGRKAVSGRALGEALRWRLTNGNFYYVYRLVPPIGVVLSLTYVQLLVVYSGGDQPWSLLAPVLAPSAIFFFVVGWAHARALPYLIALVLTFVGCVLPFALIGS
jgi:hypothetical protein